MKTILLFILLTALALDEVTRTIPIKHGECEEIRSLLKTLVPDANVSVDANSLVIQGSEAAVQQANELLDQLDGLRNPITFECQLAVVPSLKVRWDDSPSAGNITQEVYPARWFSTPLSHQTFRPAVGKALGPLQNPRVLASPRVPGYENQPGWNHLGFEFPLLYPQPDVFARYRSLQDPPPQLPHQPETRRKTGAGPALGRSGPRRLGVIPWIQRTMAFSSNIYLFITPRLEMQK